MEEKKIIVKDAFNVSDKPNHSPVKGVVVLKTEDGRIIFKKNNLVVFKGREIIRDLFYNAITNNNAASKAYNVTIKIGSGTGASTDMMTSDDFTNPRDIDVIGANESAIQSSSEATEANPDDLFIRFSISIAGSGLNAINMSELGIVLKDRDNGEDPGVLFSRIVFDPLPFTSNNNYILDYYLYF